MSTQAGISNAAKSGYLVFVIGFLGLFAFMSAILIAWPALAYIASKFLH